MLKAIFARVVVAAWFLGTCGVLSAGNDVKHVDVKHEGLMLRASIVPAGAVLAHTKQVFAGNPEDAVKALDAVLRDAGASLDSAARVNLYATTPGAAAAARKVLADRGVKCAVSAVVTDLPEPGAVVALDAVGVTSANASSDPSSVRLLRADRAVYISGMAADGEIGEATRLTLEKLDGALKHVGLGRADVIHVKSFVRGAKDVSASREQLAKFFGSQDKVPPAAWVQWTMKDPIEIEMIAQGPAAAAGATDTVTFVNPPGSKASPLYSRIAVVHGGQLIYTSGITPEADATPAPDAAVETRRALAALRALIEKSGGDFEHLVKATYYPATDATSAALNQVRPEFYNPQRPPAASKAPARHTGAEHCNLTLDLIAVTPPDKGRAP